MNREVLLDVQVGDTQTGWSLPTLLSSAGLQGQKLLFLSK